MIEDPLYPPLSAGLIQKAACLAGPCCPHVAVAKKVDSTNAQFRREWAGRSWSHWSVFGADIQTAGRGQRGRIWHSPANGNLYFTLGLPLAAPSKFPLVPLFIGLGVVDAFPNDSVYLKWPNDLLDSTGRKLGGILLESFRYRGEKYLLAGIGLNLAEVSNLPDEGNQLGVLGRGQWLPYRNLACGLVVGRVARLWEKWQKVGSAPLLERWGRAAYGMGRWVKVSVQGSEWYGIMAGVDHGARLLIYSSGKVEAFHSGELKFL